MKSFPLYRQADAMDCGPACLQMVAKYYGRYYNLPTLRDACFLTREGVSMLGISEAAESIGFRTTGVRCGFAELETEAPLPLIAHWNQQHFVVAYKIKDGKVWVADPGHGKVVYTTEEFRKCWCSTQQGEKELGVALLLEPSPDFFTAKGEQTDKTGFAYLFRYLVLYKKFILQLILGLLLGSLLQLIAPFLTQSVVDVGINTGNLGFIHLVLIAQLVLIAARLSVDFIRSWILLHISTRINISLISDFLIKLMKLPIRFFDTKMTGDIIQRIGDHSRIENFLTSQTLSILFSMFNFVIFGIVLMLYNIPIFLVFLAGSILYFSWVYLFMNRRRDIDFKRFNQMAMEQSNLIQLITGMQDGFIFSDSIARNIAVSDETVDKERLLYAVKVANIQEYIDQLPLGYNTKIGQEGVGLSQGQKQRILIARAVYKNPDFIFLDEATNALDANNEKTIMENLDHFFQGRTVVVVAHRLSTVKNADQIVVLEKGCIVERGTHRELTELRGAYYQLVKNQLELGN